MKGLVLVTGGTGSVGKCVAEKLSKEGYTIRVFDLPGAKYSGLEVKDGFEILKSDLTKEKDMELENRTAPFDDKRSIRRIMLDKKILD